MGDIIRCLLNGHPDHIEGADPTRSVLDWLRRDKGLCGAKEGCAEGDCGACTVLLGSLDAADRMIWRPLNGCILFLPMLDGRALLTVENLAAEGVLHPAQQAMVDLHGAQCGFCTPGIVMSLFARSVAAAGTRDLPARDLLAGNLCRCTGYGPILAAAERLTAVPRDDADTIRQLVALRRDAPLHLIYEDRLSGQRRHWLAPRSLAQLGDVMARHPDARLVAGATDVGLWVTKQLRVLTEVISLCEVGELDHLSEDAAGLTIGATVRYVDAHPALSRLHPDLGELVRRIGALQVRNAGTIGGNIANGSPIGDMPPALIALGAELVMRSRDGERRLALEDYFIAYGQQDRRAGEFVASLWVPRPHPDDIIRIVKLSKRSDSDISSVCAAMALRVTGGVIQSARIAFGGMAGTPRRAAACEAALTAAPWSEASLERAAQALSADFTPLSDMRGSAAYRLLVAGNLLRRLWLERQGGSVPLQQLEAIDA